ncbi:hypothetical protein J4Q44_G00387390, partial [Coregonus suidteri]
MCSANSLTAPSPAALWQEYLAALIATTGASRGTALSPARFRQSTSGASLPVGGRDGGMKWRGDLLPVQISVIHHGFDLTLDVLAQLPDLTACPLGQLVSQGLGLGVLTGG